MTATDRPTLSTVAQRAGVSLKTASRALNGEYGVAKATAEKVHAAARALGFRPNLLARSLASGGSSGMVGLVLPSLSDLFMAAVVGSVEEVLATRGLDVITASHHDDPLKQRSIVRSFVERRVDALLIVPAPGDASYLAAEVAHGVAVASLDRPVEGAQIDTVLVDNERGASIAVERLAARGHRRIAALSTNDRLWTLSERHRGYRAGLDRVGIPYAPELVSLSCEDADGAERFVSALLESDDPPTAFFSAQLQTSRGLVRALQRSGRSVDIAIFDEVFDSDLLAVRPHVIVGSSPHRLGHLAATLALRQLDAQAGAMPAPRTLVLDPMILEQDELYRAPTFAESLDVLEQVERGARGAAVPA